MPAVRRPTGSTRSEWLLLDITSACLSRASSPGLLKIVINDGVAKRESKSTYTQGAKSRVSFYFARPLLPCRCTTNARARSPCMAIFTANAYMGVCAQTFQHIVYYSPEHIHSQTCIWVLVFSVACEFKTADRALSSLRSKEHIIERLRSHNCICAGNEGMTAVASWICSSPALFETAENNFQLRNEWEPNESDLLLIVSALASWFKKVLFLLHLNKHSIKKFNKNICVLVFRFIIVYF
jgi:hypothetical protein